MAYSNYLRRIRKSAGLTQQGLADQITARGHKVTSGSVSNIERGYYKKRDGSESQPAKQFVVLAAEVCGADVNEALGEADYHAPSDTDIWKLFSKIPEEKKKAAERAIESMLFALLGSDTDVIEAVQEDAENTDFPKGKTLNPKENGNRDKGAVSRTRKRNSK